MVKIIKGDDMRWTILIVLLLLQGCTYSQNYNKETYREWYNEKEREEAQQKGREPKLIERGDFLL